MKQPWISIIVPVYNVEKYLGKCLDSILSQNTENNFEVLLIDDGSSDSSGSICDKYAECDARIHVFHKENEGVSSARNLGLDNAKGEWILFVDADDWISDEYLILGFPNDDIDVIQKSYCSVQEGSEKIKISYHVKTKVLNSEYEIYRFFLNKRNNALWDKFIRRRIIGNKRFDTKKTIGEDFLFFLSILANIKIYSFSPCGYYNYLLRSGSAMRKINNDTDQYISILRYNIQDIIKKYTKTKIKTILYPLLNISYVTLLTSNKYSDKLTSDDIDLISNIFKNTKLISFIRLASVRNLILIIISRFKFFLRYGK